MSRWSLALLVAAGLLGCTQRPVQPVGNSAPAGKVRAVSAQSEARPDQPDEAARFRYIQRLGEDGTIPPNALMIAKQQRDRMAVGQRDAGTWPASWRWLGPGNVGGRIRAILIHPTQPNTMWIGSVSGGIWKTTNGGASWRPLNDFLAGLAVGCMAIDPGNANVLYAGTGEGFTAGSTSPGEGLPGAGVFKSTDGGTTWTQLPATIPTNQDPTADPWGYVNRLAIHPTNSQIILAATNGGIWRSTDAGQNWSQRTTTRTLDLKFHPTDGTRAVAGWDDGTGQYSTDGGVTWLNATGIPSSGRVELAYARNNPTTVYASVNRSSGEVWRSTNGGQTYALQSTGTNYLEGQGWYDNVLWVDPTNANTLVVGGIDLWRSTNGGSSFMKISDWSRVPNPGDSAHADHHAIVAHPAFDGATNRTVYFGNDGGIYRTNNVYTVAQTTGWVELNNQLGITQFYGGAVNATSGRILGGTQDVGTLRYTRGTETWTTTFGGDGGFCAADPTDANYFYGEYVYCRVFRTTDGGVTACYIHNPRGCVGGNGDLVSGCPAPNWCGCPGGGNCFEGTNALSDALTGDANFISPLCLDPNDSNRLLAGAARLWRTHNAKAAQPDWSHIKDGTGSNVSAIGVADSNSDVMCVGHNNGDVYRTVNGTSANPSWTQVDNNPPGLPNRYCSRIAIDPNNHDRVYVTFMGYSAGNVCRTADAGQHWTQITGPGAPGDPGTLPAVPVSSMAIHRTQPGWLYVGTDIGVFASENDGATWHVADTGPYGDGPANVAVDELIWKDDRRLIAVTHGRGMYVADTSPARPPGLIVAWGYNDYGQCNVPAPNSGFVAVARGFWHSLGLKADGSIVAWGWNDEGQCNVPAPNSGFVAVAGGRLHSLGLKTDGSIVAWGYNAYGQCNVPAPNSAFVAVAGGGWHSLGLKADGWIVAWGRNEYGQCNVPAPNTGFAAVAGGWYHTLGLKADGSIVAWGWNEYGQCTVPAPNSRFVAVAAGNDHSLGLKAYPRGDLNCDGLVNFGDIDPFVLALSDPAAYQAAYPNCNILNGDCNGDGAVNFGDIDPFVALLSG